MALPLVAGLGSVIAGALKWALGSTISKVAVMTSLTAVVAVSLTFLLSLLPDWFSAAELTQRFSAIPASSHLIYAWNLFEIPFGLSLVFSAYAVRFIIRRLPVIG